MAQFRQDMVSGEWVLISAGRKKRPHAFAERQEPAQPQRDCVFEDLSKQELIWREPDNGDWRVAVIHNKFPAVESGVCGPTTTVGKFKVHDGKGQHDVIVYRDHDKPVQDFSVAQAVEMIRAYKRRYREILDIDGCLQYILIFHNYGQEAGASIYHPHSQLLSTPILPPDVQHSLHGAQRYFAEHGRKVYDIMVDHELEQKKRIVYENGRFVAFCPFVSKYPYEVRIFPKEGHAHFERMPDEYDEAFAQALLAVLGKMRSALKDPALNYFIHTAPTESALGDLHDVYTWHLEVIPKVKIDAGFELATGFGVNMVDPDEAAELLKKA